MKTRRGVAPLLALTMAVLVSVPAIAADRDGDGLRDGFETRWGVTDPNRRDSDRDGVIDSAEDSDGDRLSNLGEQRFGTKPNDKDSDNDGKNDGFEDKDRDGISNARAQDRRRIPRGLTPTLAGSRKDVPPRKSTCITSGGAATRIHPCKFGDTRGKTTVVIFGDSHAFHWLPALDRAGKTAGWRVVALAKGSCKSARVDDGSAPKTPCAKWRRNALRWLRGHPPDVVILASSAPHLFAAKKTWKQALRDTLAALPKKSAAVILSDSPRPNREVAVCLQKHRSNMSRCTFSRASARVQSVIDDDRAAALAGGALHATLFDKLCSYDPCPVVQGNKLIYRGVHHLTATIARQLAPSMRRIVQRALVLDAKAVTAAAIDQAS